MTYDDASSSRGHETPSTDAFTPLEGQGRAAPSELQLARALFHHAPNAALTVTRQGRVQHVNVRACTLLECEVEALQDRSFTHSLAPASHATFAALLKRVFDTPGSHDAVVQLLRRDGSVRDVIVEAAEVQVDGALPSCHLALTDVTASWAAQRHLLDENEVLKRKLQERTARVRSLHEEFEQLVGATDTQLRDALTQAQNFMWLHRRRAEHEEAWEENGNLARADEAVQQGMALLDSLARYMRTSRLRVRVRGVDLNDVLREVRKDLQPHLLDREVQLSSMTLPTVQGDPQVFQLVLFEYLSNALKFSRSHTATKLQVHVKEMESEYHVGVEDDGVGFNMRSRSKLFQPFGRLHPAGAYEGTGIGLVTVRRLCERFGGRVWAEGKVDQGAIFWFAWPKVPSLQE